MISRIEAGNRLPSLDGAVQLARAVGLDPRDALLRVIAVRDPIAFQVLRQPPRGPDMPAEVVLDPVLVALRSLPAELQQPLSTLILRFARRQSGR